jgi:hypothetical protein
MRVVFDAPGFPDPDVVGSKPIRRPTSCAVGKVPSAYPSNTTPTTASVGASLMSGW